MTSFIPLSIQKRLIRYALSRLELLDTDALDLEKLDIAWGKRSTVELRDIGIRVKRLSALLQLPDRIQVTTARILLLRLTVPADIYNSGIVVEIQGVEILARVLRDAGRAKLGQTDSKQRLHEAHSSRTPFSPYDPGGKPSNFRYEAYQDDTELPTTRDLAKSFLETESPREKRQLEEAVISQSQMLQQSISSDSSGDTESPVGTGTAFSLPTFLAKFLEGIVHRLEVTVVNVIFNLDVDIPSTSKDSGSTKETNLASVILRVENVAIEGMVPGQQGGVPREAGEYPSVDTAAAGGGGKRRCVSLRNIRAELVTAAGFDNLSQSSSSSSHLNTQPNDFDTQRSIPSSPNSAMQKTISPSATIDPNRKRFRQTDHTIHPNIDPKAAHDSIRNDGGEHNLRSSIITDDGSRFADAADATDSSGPHSLVPVTSEPLISESQTDDSIFEDPPGDHAYLGDLVDDALWSSDVEATNEPEPPFAPNLALSVGLPDKAPSIKPNIEQTRGLPGQKAEGLSVTVPQLFYEGIGSHYHAHSPLRRSTPTAPPGYLSDDYFQRRASNDKVPQPLSHEDLLNVSENLDIASDSSSRTPSPSAVEDLAQSKMFSHEEAESMYMSAFSTGPGDDKRLGIRYDASSTSDNASGACPEAGTTYPPGLQSSAHSLEEINRGRRCVTTQVPTRSASGSLISSQLSPVLPSTPTRGTVSPQSFQEPSLSTASGLKTSRSVKRVFEVDEVSIWLPSTPDAAAVADQFPTLSARGTEPVSAPRLGAASAYADMPGAFATATFRESSTYPASRAARKDTSGHPVSPSKFPLPTPTSPASVSDTIDIAVGHITARVDLSVGRLIAQVVQQVAAALRSGESLHDESDKRSLNRIGAAKGHSYKCRLQSYSLDLLEHLPGIFVTGPNALRQGLSIGPNSSGGDPLLVLKMTDLDIFTLFNGERSEVKITLGQFRLELAEKPIVCFNQEATLNTSTRPVINAQHKDILLTVVQTRELVDIGICTRPIQISLDLQRLDDTLSCVGGFSGILELGSSMASNSTVLGHSPRARRPRGVRFEGLPEDISMEQTSSKVRIQSRLGGAEIRLYGTRCSVQLNTSAIKLIGRQQGIGLRIDKITMSGPHTTQREESAPVTISLDGVKVEFAFTPNEADLDQLLCLLTPSQDKYENDDDILIDTLLRQRRKGSVFRVGVNTADVHLEHRGELLLFGSISEELARLSSVTKYLPEDDRPGILTLLKCDDLKVQITLKRPMGTFDLACVDTSLAHVGLPSLVALAIERISLQGNDKETLIGEVLPQQATIQLPMVMARIIGDEVDPTLKVKLWNVCVEYQVSTLMDLMGILGGTTAEAMAVDIAASVATIRNRSEPKAFTRESSGLTEKSSTSLKPLSLDLLMRHCAIGMTPCGLPSKGLLVLTDSRFAGSLPGKESLQATFEVRKASMLIIDDMATFLARVEASKPISSGLGSPQVAELCRRGFVSVSTISAAKAIVRVTENVTKEQQLVDVELRDELFVLETCADSTQTLFAILNGLKPPTPSNKEVKYRTEVVPVQDMLASFTSDAYKPDGTVDHVPLDFQEDDDFTDEKPTDFEFDGSFYRSRAKSGSDDVEDDILDDGFDTLSSPLADQRVGGKALLESFKEQYEIQPENSRLDVQENYFGSGSEIAGITQRWDSAKNRYGRTEHTSIPESPLKVRIRDVHIIWNLFDGYDWQRTRDTISKAVKELEMKAEERKSERRLSKPVDEEDEESVIGDFLFNSIYIGIPANREPRELSRQINRDLDDLASETGSYATTAVSRSPSRQGAARVKSRRLRLGRSKHHKIAFELKGVSADLIVFPPGSGETQSSVDLRVKDFEIFDLVPTSTWKKFMTYMHDAGEREMGRPMFHFEVLNVRPVANLAASELVLRVSVLPLRLHVDQDALEFISRFFEFKDESSTGPSSKADEPFLQRVEVNAVRMKLDYKPKKVDYAGLRSGHTNEFKNFFILDGAEMVLRHVIIYGIVGFDKLHKTLNDIWTPDVLKNQLPGVLSGLGPMRSLVNLAGGVRDLVVIPVEEYRKDGRVGRSISKGALRFVRTTGGELARLGTKLAIGTQTALQGAEDFLVKPHQRDDGGWEDAELDEEEKKVISLYADQPVGVVQGLRGAVKGLQRDLLTARDAIVAIPGEVMESSSATGAAKAVLRHAPTIILRPGIGATKAIGQTLMGATNSLDPQNRRRIEDKYKRH